MKIDLININLEDITILFYLISKKYNLVIYLKIKLITIHFFNLFYLNKSEQF